MSAVRQRQRREEDPGYLAFVRKQPCTICARPGPNDPAHLRSAAPQYGKRPTGMGEKPDDKWTLPLCRPHHDDQHRDNELRWWARHGIPDPFALAAALYASRPNPQRPRRERRVMKRSPAKERKPKAERKAIAARPNAWPPKGSRKIPTRARTLA